MGEKVALRHIWVRDKNTNLFREEDGFVTPTSPRILLEEEHLTAGFSYSCLYNPRVSWATDDMFKFIIYNCIFDTNTICERAGLPNNKRRYSFHVWLVQFIQMSYLMLEKIIITTRPPKDSRKLLFCKNQRITKCVRLLNP